MLGGEKGAGKKCIVDDDDYEHVSKHRWHIATGCAETRIKGKTVKMHRLITKFAYEFVDHINGNVLDNRKCNLRSCTRAENARNSKPWGRNEYKGVSKNGGSWNAVLIFNRRRHVVCGFSTQKDAAIMYNYMAKQFFGEFARLNNTNRRNKK